MTAVLGDDTKLIIHGVTDVGMNREHNEDSIAWDERLGLILLADGMGGHNAGEVASAMAVDMIKDALQEVLLPDVLESGRINYGDAVREAITYANEKIFSQSHTQAECAGMGTTIVMALFQKDFVIVANVGDSRLYRMREDELQQITSDHSLVQEMVDNGYLSEEEALISANRNLITRALGIAAEVEVDVREEVIRKGDIYLLCSDGLSDLVADEDIARLLRENLTDLELATRKLVELANEKGGTDNISVIVVGVREAFSDKRGFTG